MFIFVIFRGCLKVNEIRDKAIVFIIKYWVLIVIFVEVKVNIVIVMVVIKVIYNLLKLLKVFIMFFVKLMV